MKFCSSHVPPPKPAMVPGALLTGVRQVGKSTLLKHLFQKEYKCVSLDDPFLEEQAKTDGNMFLMLNPPPVIVDEVQHAPELFRYIKKRCDESDAKGMFFLSGSQPFQLMKKVSDSLSGRIHIVELLSLRVIQHDTFNERFLPTMEYVAAQSKTASSPEIIWEIIHRGGYPALLDKEVEWSAYYADYVKTYLERDVHNLAMVFRKSGMFRVDDLGADTASNPLYGSLRRNGSSLQGFLFQFVLLVCCGHSLLVFPFSEDAGQGLNDNQDSFPDIHRNRPGEILESFGIYCDFTHCYASFWLVAASCGRKQHGLASLKMSSEI